MSRESFINDGNDTIDRYPLSYRGRLTKLLCISKLVFEKLTLAAREFFVKPVCQKRLPAPVQENKPSFKQPEACLADNGNTGHSEYAPSQIWNTRNSRLWQWRRLSEWWREYHQDEFVNEKRHILL